METNTRLAVKALCWQASGLITMTLIGYVVTGSLGQGGTLAATTTAIGLAAYFVHEKIWARIAWGRRPAGNGH